MNKDRFAQIALTLLMLILAGCASQTAPTPAAVIPTPTAHDPLAQAAAEATAIVLQAQATALVLQAQAQATQLIEQAGLAPATPEAPVTTTAALTLAVQATAPANEAPAPDTPSTDLAAQVTPAAETVELLGVSFAAEGGFLIVNFRAPPSVVQDWYQGRVSVTNEASQTVFNEIPVLPVIGPLIGRPVEAGQIGYVMLTHNPPTLRPGNLVTVILGEYKFEHVKVE
jgi:hypothetical protein